MRYVYPTDDGERHAAGAVEAVRGTSQQSALAPGSTDTTRPVSNWFEDYGGVAQVVRAWDS